MTNVKKSSPCWKTGIVKSTETTGTHQSSVSIQGKERRLGCKGINIYVPQNPFRNGSLMQNAHRILNAVSSHSIRTQRRHAGRIPASRISKTALDTRDGLKRQSLQRARDKMGGKRKIISQCRQRSPKQKRKSEQRRRKWSRQSRDNR